MLLSRYKGWFPYDRYNRWKNIQQSLRFCGNHFLAIVTITAIMWKPACMENAQRSKSQRPLNFFGSDSRDYIETSLKVLT